MDFLSSNAVLAALKVSDKKTALHHLAATAARLTGIHERVILDAAIAREKLGSTGLGKGIAVPHARLTGLDHVVGIFAQLKSPIAYDAVDDQPVDVMFMLLSPAAAGADHLQALARISRALRDDGLVDRLRGATSADAVYALLTQSDLALAA